MGQGRFPLLEQLLLTACCLLLGAAMIFDILRREVPNLVPLAVLGLFVVQWFFVDHHGPMPLWTNIAAGAVLLALGFGLFLFGALGAGDGKLMAVAGLWIGPLDISAFLFGVGLLGLGVGLFCLLPFDATRRLRSNIPFAVAIAPPAIVLLALRAYSVTGSS